MAASTSASERRRGTQRLLQDFAVLLFALRL
jgi:hypothetical protein